MREEFSKHVTQKGDRMFEECQRLKYLFVKEISKLENSDEFDDYDIIGIVTMLRSEIKTILRYSQLRAGVQNKEYEASLEDLAEREAKALFQEFVGAH